MHNSSKSQHSGYVKIEELITHLQSIGYTIPQINKVILIAYEKKLVETSERGAELKADIIPNMLRITSLGAYISQNAIEYFAYIDAIVVDTPILTKASEKKYKMFQN
ncbi:MAG: hypothetical protein IPN94_10915 [Sphingobacteriales bacterium]|nr:hypothetical protein [Sphingobacteriales bacterium]